jgi:hypothetical protein
MMGYVGKVLLLIAMLAGLAGAALFVAAALARNLALPDAAMLALAGIIFMASVFGYWKRRPQGREAR